MEKITHGFIDQYGREYPDIKLTTFDSLQELRKDKLESPMFTNSHKICTSSFIDDSGDVSIYSIKNNPNIAYKLYKDLNFYEYSCHSGECKTVQDLIVRQPMIKLTKFPLGVVGIQDPNVLGKYHIVGQEIQLYRDYINLLEAFEQNEIKQLSKLEILKIYQRIIKIFQELRNNSICYNDIHRGNILLNPTSLDVKLIDFDGLRMNFNGYDKQMIDNLKRLYLDLNAQYGMGFTSDIYQTQSIDEIGNFMTRELTKL